MKLFTLNALIDDILLIVRNNNISESEDLSRTQIEQWIHHYRAQLIKQDITKGRDINPSYTQMLDPIELEKVAIDLVDTHDITSTVECDSMFKYKSIEPIPRPIDLPFGIGIISVTDLHDCTIQKISRVRRHFQWLRRTGKEYTYYYQPDHIYVQGVDTLRYIRVAGIFEDPTEAGLKPDESYPIPVDKIGALKQLIFASELNFMLQRPSDDQNNATLADIKPSTNG